MENQTETETEKEITTIDMTPTWAGVLRMLLLLWTDGDLEGRKVASEELFKMATLADKWVAVVQQKKDEPLRRKK